VFSRICTRAPIRTGPWLSPVAEDRALSDLDRLPGPADQHPVLQHRRVVAQRDAAGAGAQHDTLRQ
jgi:hypothetical protein